MDQEKQKRMIANFKSCVVSCTLWVEQWRKYKDVAALRTAMISHFPSSPLSSFL